MLTKLVCEISLSLTNLLSLMERKKPDDPILSRLQITYYKNNQDNQNVYTHLMMSSSRLST